MKKVALKFELHRSVSANIFWVKRNFPPGRLTSEFEQKRAAAAGFRMQWDVKPRPLTSNPARDWSSADTPRSDENLNHAPSTLTEHHTIPPRAVGFWESHRFSFPRLTCFNFNHTFKVLFIKWINSNKHFFQLYIILITKKFFKFI